MEFEINKRIQLYIDELKITPYEFSKRMGNKRPDGLYKILDLKTNPSPKTLDKIKESFPEINYNWLLTGEGAMKKGVISEELQVNEEQAKYGIKDLQSVHLDLKQDLKELSAGITRNFEVVSEGIFEGLKGQQKIIRFIEALDAKEITLATSKLNKYLEEQYK